MDPIKKIQFVGMKSNFLCSFNLFWVRRNKTLPVPLNMALKRKRRRDLNLNLENPSQEMAAMVAARS